MFSEFLFLNKKSKIDECSPAWPILPYFKPSYHNYLFKIHWYIKR